MNKIEILDKEFEVGDMVEVEEIYTGSKYAGYLTGEHTKTSIVNHYNNKGATKIDTKFITLAVYNWYIYSGKTIHISHIKSINKLVHEQ